MSVTRIIAPSKKYPPMQRTFAWYQTPDGVAMCDLAYQKTGFGEKCFLVCPICGARRQFLYVCNHNAVCRDHLLINGRFRGGAYNGIQYTTKGGSDRIAYTMRKIAEKHFIDYRIGNDPLSYVAADKRPRYMPKKKFADVMARLDLLERLRDNAIMATFPLFGRSAAHLEKNVPLIAAIERSSIEELSDLSWYVEDMSLAQYLYGQDWGFPLLEE